MSRLADADFIGSEAHDEMIWSALGRGEAAAEVLAFHDGFLKDAGRLKIPLYAARFTVTTVEILHCQWRYSLPADDWSILAYIGRYSAARLGLVARWAPELYQDEPFFVGEYASHDPARWNLTVPAGMPVRVDRIADR